MSGNVEKKLAEMEIALPTPAAPIANYVGFVRSGRLLFVSGQLCLAGGELVAKGKLGAEVTKPSPPGASEARPAKKKRMKARARKKLQASLR